MTTVFEPQSEHMRRALDDARDHLAALEGGPFGACIVHRGQVIAAAHNTVLKHHDPTCHAEVNAIRVASRTLATHVLDECVIYSTTEPCPMCFSAIHWARIPIIVFGTRIADVQRLGFNELAIENTRMKQLGNSEVLLVEDFMRDDCLALLNDWQDLAERSTY